MLLSSETTVEVQESTTEVEAVTMDLMRGGLRIVVAATMIVTMMVVQVTAKTIRAVVGTLIIVGINHLVVPGMMSNRTEASEIGTHTMNHPKVEEAMMNKINGVGTLSSAQTTTVTWTRTVVAVEITTAEEIGSAKKVVEG